MSATLLQNENTMKYLRMLKRSAVTVQAVYIYNSMCQNVLRACLQNSTPRTFSSIKGEIPPHPHKMHNPKLKSQNHQKKILSVEFCSCAYNCQILFLLFAYTCLCYQTWLVLHRTEQFVDMFTCNDLQCLCYELSFSVFLCNDEFYSP